jgi:hypothetical protein
MIKNALLSSNILILIAKQLYSKMNVSFFMPDKIHCANILVKTETEAKNIKARLNKGEKFGALATTFLFAHQERTAVTWALLQGVRWLRSLRRLHLHLRRDRLLVLSRQSLGTT